MTRPERSFDSFSAAFDYCRRKDQPVVVFIREYPYAVGVYKLYPSGKAEERNCHMCPTGTECHDPHCYEINRKAKGETL